MKRCSKCGQDKPHDGFYVRSSSPDGLRGTCKDCSRATRRQKHQQDPAAVRRRGREWWWRQLAKDPEGWRLANRIRARESYAIDPSQAARAVASRRRQRQQDAPETVRALERARYARNEKRRALFQRRAAARRALKTHRLEPVDRAEVLRRADGLCGICGSPVDPMRFHVDHIIPLSRGGEHSYANTQPAHPGCNIVKRDKLPCLA